MEDPGGGGMESFNYGMIRPGLLDQLKSILHQYPDDGQILKELVQNADDAGATQVKFMLDSTHYPTQRLFSPDMEPYQGPALLAYNDATFSTEDWRGIRMMYASVKKTDALKVGRFGLGFKSVFHMTDVPSLVSGSGVAFIDPHETLFREARTRGRPTSSYRWDMAEDRTDMEAIPDQWAPYRHALFGLDEDVFRAGHYDHTLFRFPLRPAKHDSQLSDVAYTAEKMERIFHSLRVEGHLHLLFLRHLESIELYTKSADSAEPELVYRVCIADDCLDAVREKRRELLEKMRSGEDCSMTYELTLDVLSGGQEEVYKYIVCQHFATAAADDEAAQGVLPQHMPLVGAALPLHDAADSALTSGGGHVFCFLPLPLEKTSPTGLDVHVNGYFGVEQNRRHIKWPTADQSDDDVTDGTLLWNLYLLRKLLPAALCALARFSAARVSQGTLSMDQYQRLFPDVTRVTAQWLPLVAVFYRLAASEALYFPTARGSASHHHQPGPVAATDATFCSQEDHRSVALHCRILAEDGISAVMLPKHILEGLMAQPVSLISTPALYECLLRVQDTIQLRREDRGQLLVHLADHHLDALKLLPRANEEWIAFNRQEPKVYVASSEFPADLLPNQPHKFVSSSQHADVQRTLTRIAQQERYQVKMFTKDSAVEELRRMFADVGNDPVVTRPHTMSSEWLQKVWEFLHQRVSDLSDFEGLPIIPLPDGKLCQLSRTRPIMIEQPSSGRAMQGKLKDVLPYLNCTIIPRIPDYVKRHPYVDHCILQPHQLARAIRLANDQLRMQHSSSLGEHISGSGMPHEARRHLRLAITELSKPEADDIVDILRSLPLCETIDGSGQRRSHFVSAREVKYSGPTTRFPVSLPERLIQVSSTAEERFAGLLGIPKKTTADVLVEMLPRLVGQTEVESIAEMAMEKFSEYNKQHHKFLETMKQLKCVSTKRRGLVAPWELVAPSNDNLKELLAEIDALPVGKFSPRRFLPILEQLGLRTTPTEDELYSIAVTIDKLTIEGNPRSKELAQRLLSVFEQDPAMFSTRVKQSIQNLRWVPVVAERCTGYPSTLPWPTQIQLTVKPTEGVQVKHANLCGSSCIMMPNSSLLPSQVPGLESVVMHLKTCTAERPRGQKDVATMAVVIDVYSFLQKKASWEVMDGIQKAGLRDWIWKGDGFTSASRIVAERPSISVQPYIYTLPSECRNVKDMFLQCGMSEKCSYVEVLKMMKEYHDANPDASAEERQRDLVMALSVLSQLSKANEANAQPGLLVPIHSTDDRLHLCPVEECVYCDVEWLQKGIDLSNMDEDEDNAHIKPVHRDISNLTSERLGVANIMSRILCAEDLDMSFGQSESLVDRISSLLKEYRDGLAILKELVQNADDAGATEVKLVYDERENNNYRVTVLDDGMKDLQGPALWSYNDAEFTENDFENIKKLGGKTKETATNKIGKFGLGFNAVYNLTDVPCFISGNNIVYFDPNTTNLGAALPNKNNPGIKLDLTKKRVRRQIQRLPDQFHPFNGVLDCNLTATAESHRYNGTLFRFPLRTAKQAATSKICNIHYSKEEVIKLLKMLHGSRHTLLVFTQNVCKVSVHHIAAGANGADEMTDMFSIEKSITDESHFVIPGQRQIPASKVLHAASLAKEQKVKEELTATFVLENRCSTSDGRFPVEEDQEGRQGDVKKYLVCSTISGGSALDMAQTSQDLVPVGGVAIELDHTGSICTQQTKTHVFCFMTLPLDSPYPVHINGYFSVTANRTRLCEQDIHDKMDSGAVWNEHLIQDAVCGAYMSLLEKLTQQEHCLTMDRQKQTFDVWPQARSGNHQKVFNKLDNSFYARLLGMEAPKLFPSSKGWVSFKDCVFMEQSYRHSKVGEVAFALLKKHFNGAVVDLPSNVYQRIKTFQPCQIFTEETFLKEILLPNFTAIDPDEATAILVDAVLRSKEEKSTSAVWVMLAEQAWVPTTPHGQQLKKPSELINPHGPLKELYTDDDERYPLWKTSGIKTICQDYDFGAPADVMAAVLKGLKDLGMKQDEISWQELLERATTVQHFEQKDGMQRVACLISLMERLMSRNNTPSHADRVALRRIPFLPSAQKLAGFPLGWNLGIHVTWVTSDESHLMKMSDLVGSVMPLVEEQVFPVRLYTRTMIHELLGFQDKEVPIDLVMKQLDSMTECDLSQMAPNEMQHLRLIATAVYGYLQDFIKQETVKKTDNTEQLEMLRQKQFLLFDGFNMCVEAKEIAEELILPCEPYLFKLPSSFKRRFPDLLVFLGVRKSFEASDFINVLLSIHEKCQQSKISEGDHTLVCNVARMLYNLKDTGATAENDCLQHNEPIYLPNQLGIMCKSDELCYDDCHWLDTDEKMQFCHGDIPFPAAHFLGVKTKRQAKVNQHQIGISFGQKEKLTTRLKRLLTGYPCGIEILKEMLQNADDAGAERIHFILDPRTHQAEKVFDDKWKTLHGPALLVYNDKPFTQKDLDGIQNLGEGSKASDPNKTGKYGVGFNCVYHLTDTPTFLTTVEGQGKQLCALDPHCRYVTSACPECPGQMFEVDKLKKDFPDVFACYMSDEPSLSTENGTMFRLPFRTSEAAESSQISNNAFDCNKMKILFREFKKQLSEMLLFINSVQTVTLSEVDETTGKLKTICEVHAALSDENAKRRQEFHCHVKDEMHKVEKNEIRLHEAKMMEIAYDLEITKKTEALQEQWRVVQRFGVESPNDVPDRVKTASEKHDLGLCPRGGVAYKKPSGRIPYTPPLHGKVFCFLPLPLNTDLPVHVNGNFALSYETRQDLVVDERSSLSDWNGMMYQGIIAPAYVTLLQDQMDDIPKEGPRNDVESRLRCYFDMFPSVPQDKNHRDLKHQFPLRAGLYERIHRKHLSLLPMLNKNNKESVAVSWHPVDDDDGLKTYFDTLNKATGTGETPFRSGCLAGSYPKTSASKPIHETQAEIMIRCGMVLIDAPMNILKYFQMCGIPAKAISPQNVATFMNNRHCTIQQLPRLINETPLTTRDDLITLVKYLWSSGSTNPESLRGLPIVLTRDNMLRKLGHSKVFHTFHYRAVFTVRDCILHEDLLNVIPEEHFSTLTMADFAEMLPLILPPKFKGKNVKVPMSELPTLLPKDWLINVWIFIEAAIKKENVETGNEGTRVINLKDIEPIAEWSLVPCYDKGESYLVPVGKANAVLDLAQGDQTSQTLREALMKLPVWIPNYSVLTSNSSKLEAPSLRMLVATINNPETVLWALSNVREDIMQTKATFTDLELEKILEYYANSIDKLRKVPESMETLMSLPIFQTVTGKHVSLQVDGARYVVPQRVPTEEIDAFQNTSRYVFLQEDARLKNLYMFLGCTFLEIEEFYLQFVLEQFHEMTDKGRLAHLQFLKDVTQEENCRLTRRAMLMGRLREVPFMKHPGEETLKTASSYYDPHNEVFKSLTPQMLLPPKPFQSKEWRKFLVELGLISIVTEEHIVSFCKHLEKIGSGQLTQGLMCSISEKAHLIVKFLCSDENQPTCTFTAIKDIKFLPPHQVGQDKHGLCPQVGSEQGCLSLQCFSGSAFASEEDYVWSCVPLIPQLFHPEEYLPRHVKRGKKLKLWNGRQKRLDGILARLEVRFPISMDTIAKHADNVCKNVKMKLQEMQDVGGRDKLYTSLTEVMSRIFGRVKNENGRIDQCFGPLRIIPVKRGQKVYFATASEIITKDLKICDEIIPHLFSIPLDYGPYADLFLKMGSVETVSVETYVRVLKQIHCVANGEELHPDEKTATMKAYEQICYLIVTRKECTLSELELYLPGLDSKLHRSHQLVFNDQPRIMSRLNEFNGVFLLDIGDFYFMSNVLRHLPVQLRPQPLSSLVVEVMIDGMEECDRPSPEAIDLMDRLSSQQFHEGLCRLIIWKKKKAAERNAQACNPADLVPIINEKINSIQVTTIHRLTTHLVYQNNVVPSSEERQPVFIRKKGDQLEVVLEENARYSPLYLAMRLLQHIQEMCGTYFNHGEPLFMSPLDEISADLDLFVPRLHDTSVAQTYSPSCGDLIPVSEHYLLTQRVEALRKDQYVGILYSDPLDEEEEMMPSYKYGKIVEHNNPEELILLKWVYSVNVGRNDIELNILLLHSFQRAPAETDAADNTSVPEIASKTLEEINASLTDQLEAAYSLPGNTAHELGRRLLQVWDPVEYPEYQERASRVYEHLKAEIKRLEARRLTGYDYPAGGDRGLTQLASYYSSDEYFDYIQSRCRTHQQQQQTFRKNRSSQQVVDGFYLPKQSGQKNPQPEEGRRWLKQAQYDLQAASNDDGRSNEWVCFKCYQAAEKAMRGAQLSVDAQKRHTKHLPHACWDGDEELGIAARELQNLVKNEDHMLYPVSACLPHNSFSDHDAQRAQQLAQSILAKADHFVRNNSR